MVIELLTTDNIHRANKIAAKLNRLNLERQDIEARMKEIATSFVETGPDLPWGITVFHEDFHTGVIGIVAQRLVERFYRPTVVMGKEGEIYKGSARGIKNFNVVEALRELGHLLTKFGGHEGAGGFSIKAENISYFVSEFNKLCLAKLKDIRTHPVIEADTEVCLDELSLELVDEFKSFAPFGIGNPGTQLLIDKLTVIEQKILKEAHLKVTLSDGKSQMTGLMWHTTHHPAISIGSKIRAVVRPSVNTFRGVHEVQVGIQAVEGV